MEKVLCYQHGYRHDTTDTIAYPVDLAKNIDNNLNKFKQESMENFHVCNC